ncbi:MULTISPECIES: heme NO-binding domain-containing protein [Clostridium]|uniref:heme NO-binding domain-containing protein n=1 Tax=Clostridium TaxID=1485 RepID=UPI000C0833D7|nr:MULTISPECIES: heme NO-binding domain-containing protein [Clostridium]MBS7131297.1 heme NO-binding domain-containing protein [Clostridium sp.]MDB2093806.1 heme NO-binding domain-containing protein [Clostridium paraputrificum]MDB2117988.1 heme NO-binding domain-containing protein [Clostridium paraputrificum]MDB2120669.1 heme NO-binding domain-containing protein [Clostridium paraputrificum]MDU2283435.1 heme NO-binding domain-containing protein [Clostridium sp.]
MKGTVVATWLNTTRKLFGDDVVKNAMSYAGWGENKIFSPIENVEDDKVNKYIKYISDNKNITTKELWRKIGQDNIISFSKDYPAFFKHENAYSFLKSMYDVHVVMTKKFIGAKPPILTITPISRREAIFTYNSSRGMFEYFLGMLEGVGNYFNEKIQVEEISKTKTSLELKLIFNQDIHYNKEYKFNTLMSLGFIKNFGVKAGLFTGITLFVILIPLMGVSNIIKSIIASIIAGGLTYLGTNLMLSPLSQLKEELNRLVENRYNIDESIKTNDFFEDIYEKIKEHKKIIQSDFVSFKGLTDEMSTFIKKIDLISASMQQASESIDEVVGQVANSAVEQAGQTDEVVMSLEENINALGKIVQVENSYKNNLEEVLKKINKSNSGVEKSSRNIGVTLESFNDVKVKSEDLEKRANDITKIVSIVAGIAEQTNLLALNASIEAARAGEQGKGFSVVAESIKKLSEQSKESVKEINTNLVHFKGNIESLVEQIENQYFILEKETLNLQDVENLSFDANKSINYIASSMINTINDLNEQSKSIESLSNNIKNLSSIAEENSAYSEEGSASVTQYTQEINNLTENISNFEKIANMFKEELEKYKI